MPPRRSSTSRESKQSVVSRVNEQRCGRYATTRGITPPNRLDSECILATVNVKNAELLKRPGYGLSFFAETASLLPTLVEMSHGHCSEDLEKKVLEPLQTIFDHAKVEKLVQPVGANDTRCAQTVFEDNEKEEAFTPIGSAYRTMVAKSVKQLISDMRKFGSKEDNVRYLEEATQAFYGLYNLLFEVTRFVGIVTHPQEYAGKCKSWISDPSLEQLRKSARSEAAQEQCFVNFWQRYAVEQCRKRKEKAPAKSPMRDSGRGTLLGAEEEVKKLRAENARLKERLNGKDRNDGSDSTCARPPSTKKARIAKEPDFDPDGGYDSSSSSSVSLPKPQVPRNWRVR